MTRLLGAWLITALGVSSLGCPSTVTPPPVIPPVITRFTVDQARVAQGGSVQFSFAVQGASAVTLVDQSGAELPVVFDAPAGIGNATHAPTATSFYVLRAEGEGGRDAAFLQVAVDEELASLFLVVVPRVVHAGETVDVLWSSGGQPDVTVTEGQRTLSTATMGSLQDTPPSSTTYTLSVKQVDGSLGTLAADVQVIPVIEAFTAEPPAAMPGETITLRWATAGGERVALSEATFGALHDDAVNVAAGEFAFVVPTTYADAGVPSDAGVTDGGAGPALVREGLPLRFTLVLTTTTPAQSVSAAVEGRVGKGAVIDRLDVPPFTTEGRPLNIGWSVRGAARVQLQVNGAVVFEPPPGQSLDARFTLPSTTGTTDVTLVAWDDVGLSTRAMASSTAVPPPAIASFTVPASVTGPTAPIQAAWQTSGATAAVLRVKDGPNLYASDSSTEVASGMHTFSSFLSSTFVLEARNAAGDVATAEGRTQVAGNPALTFSPEPCGADQPLVAQWDVAGLPLLDLPGLPATTPQLTTTPGDFVDLDLLATAKTLRFANGDDSGARFTAPGGFRFPFVTRQETTFTATTNGALVLGSGLAGNTNLDVGAATYAGAPMLAPFWDDLTLGANGTVKYDLLGQAFPRRLVVQWSKLQKGATAGSELTFQVQLSETGAFRFLYKTLDNVDTNSATIGAVDTAGTFRAAFGFNTAGKVSAGQVLWWFSGELTRAMGSHTYLPPRAAPFGFFVQDSSARLTPLYGTPRVIARGELLIDEVMPVPDQAVNAGRFVELVNASDRTLDLTGLELVSGSGSASPFYLSFALDAGARVVLGQTTNATDNGGANVSIAWGAGQVTMTSLDSVEVRTPGGSPFVIANLSWDFTQPDSGAPGQSVQANLAPVDGSGAFTDPGAPLSCPRVSTYGTFPAQLGTPGARPDDCFEYRLDRVPFAWDEIAGLGRPLVTGADDRDNAYDTVTFSPPLRYFRETYGTVTIGTDGWMKPGTAVVPSPSNRVKASDVGFANGIIGVFWDDLVLPADRAGANVYLLRRADHYVVEWYRAAHTGALGDEINAQVKLFDDGVIELHYGELVNTNAALRYAEGGSATAWLERPLGVPMALGVVRNTTASTAQSFLAPRTAWRFTPNP